MEPEVEKDLHGGGGFVSLPGGHVEEGVSLLTVLTIQVLSKVIEDLSQEPGNGWLVHHGSHLQNIGANVGTPLSNTLTNLNRGEMAHYIGLYFVTVSIL